MYVAPFRKDLKRGHCIICNKPTNARYIIKGEENDCGELNDVLCTCPSATNCVDCKVINILPSYIYSLLNCYTLNIDLHRSILDFNFYRMTV